MGQDAVTQLEQCVKTAKDRLSDTGFRLLFSRFCGNAVDSDAEWKRLDKLVKAKRQEEQQRQQENPSKQSTFRFQKWKRQGPGKNITRVHLFVLFHCDGGSEFTAAMLKAHLKKLFLNRLALNRQAALRLLRREV